MKIREKIARKLFPEVYEQVDKASGVVLHYEALKHDLTIVDKEVRINGPTAVLGNIINCKVDITPNINSKLVLSEYKLDAMLKVSGSQQAISGCYFRNEEQEKEVTAIDLKADESIIKGCSTG